MGVARPKYWFRGGTVRASIRGSNPSMYEWLASMEPLDPEKVKKMILVKEVLKGPEMLKEREIHWIEHYAKRGHRLFNRVGNPKKTRFKNGPFVDIQTQLWI